MPDADQIRATQRATWDTFSAGWEAWDSFVQASIGPVGDAVIEALEVAADQRHLEVAAGTGEPGLSIAALAPEGRVTLTDLSSGMLAAAERFAAARELRNVEVRVASADDLPFDDGAFDSVGCRFGFMFFPDLDAAAAELARVVRSGGRVATAVWAGPEHNLWATLPMPAIASEVDVPPPDPDAPGLFRCAAPGAITAVFERAGLTDVAERDTPVEFGFSGEADYWRMVTDLTAPVAALLAGVDDATRARIAEKVEAAAGEHRSGAEVRLTGMARCIVGTKP